MRRRRRAILVAIGPGLLGGGASPWAPAAAQAPLPQQEWEAALADTEAAARAALAQQDAAAAAARIEAALALLERRRR